MARGVVSQSGESVEAQEGRVLAGRYRTIRRLGLGGAAAVYLAEDEHLGRRVGVKLLHSHSPEDAARRFAREAKLGASLNHPNIVTVFDSVADEDSVLIVMEYVPGTDLGKLLKRGPLEPAHALGILGSVASALDHAHEHGVIHRDVKPPNILLREDGTPKLADLGIARALESTAITESGMVIGTLLYMSPEQLRGEEACPPSDVYALALIAFEALSGKRVRRPGSAGEVSSQAENEPRPDLSEARPGTPRGAAAILKQAFDPDPDRRPGSASAMIRDLGAALELESTRPMPPPPIPVPEAHPSTEPEPFAAEAAEAEPEVAAVEAAAEPLGAEPEAADSEPAGGEYERRPFYVSQAKRRRPLVPFAILRLLVAGAIAAIVIAAGGGGGSDQSGSGRGANAKAGTHGGAASGSTSQAATGGAGTAGVAGGTGAPVSSSPSTSASAGDPTTAVNDFYERAASGDYQGAWSLADSSARSQLGGYGAFQSQESSLQSIDFTQLTTTNQTADSATVSFADDADHGSFVDHCTGSIGRVSSGGTWLVDQFQNIGCSRTTG